MEINAEELRKFILEASQATYASGDESIKENLPDKSTTITYESGDYRFHDNYFGGEPYGGREVVFLNNQPIWMMVYYGFVHEDAEAKELYSFLMESLSQAMVEIPYRGPSLYQRENLRYENSCSGDVEKFSGIEKIYRDEVCVYEASYMGGVVDVKP